MNTACSRLEAPFQILRNREQPGTQENRQNECREDHQHERGSPLVMEDRNSVRVGGADQPDKARARHSSNDCGQAGDNRSKLTRPHFRKLAKPKWNGKWLSQSSKVLPDWHLNTAIQLQCYGSAFIRNCSPDRLFCWRLLALPFTLAAGVGRRGRHGVLSRGPGTALVSDRAVLLCVQVANSVVRNPIIARLRTSYPSGDAITVLQEPLRG